MNYCKWTAVCAIGIYCIAITGCNPSPPGVSGEVKLGANVTPSDFKTLELRASPDPEKTFDPADPQFPSPAEWSWTDEDLSQITFPYEYELRGGIGPTSERDWRLFVWLSAGDATDAPAPGEPFGTTLFAIADCGPASDDYCGITEGVDVTLNRTAP